MNRTRMLLNRRQLLATAAATIAAPAVLRAQSGPLKVGVLLPRSGYRGRHRPGLPARRRYRGRHPEVSRAAGTLDHERRYRVERRYRARTCRETDQRRRPAPGRHIRFRPDHRGCPGGRTEGHSFRHQYRRRPRHHRAGLQVRVPEFPDCTDAGPRRLFGTEGSVRDYRQRAEDRRVHARQRYVRHGDVKGLCRGHAKGRHAVHDLRTKFPTIRRRAICRSR